MDGLTRLTSPRWGAAVVTLARRQNVNAASTPGCAVASILVRSGRMCWHLNGFGECRKMKLHCVRCAVTNTQIVMKPR